MPTTDESVNADDLRPSEEAVLDVLRAHAATPAALQDMADLSKGSVHGALRALTAGGHVEKIHESGLYELADDPRDGDDETATRAAEPSVNPDTGGRHVDAGPTTTVDFSDAVDDAVSHMAGGDELPDTRTPALHEAVTQLRRDGEATVDDLVSGAYRREAGGFTSADSYRRSITAALDALAERRPEIETDGDRYVWRGGE